PFNVGGLDKFGTLN
nr:RecName: Full=Feruloyl-CoA thioesterase [Nicotiana tabacum]